MIALKSISEIDFKGEKFVGVTIKDVARRANVSPSTVSRVFTGSANVSPANREAVLKAAKELNFKTESHGPRPKTKSDQDLWSSNS